MYRKQSGDCSQLLKCAQAPNPPLSSPYPQRMNKIIQSDFNTISQSTPRIFLATFVLFLELIGGCVSKKSSKTSSRLEGYKFSCNSSLSRMFASNFCKIISSCDFPSYLIVFWGTLVSWTPPRRSLDCVLKILNQKSSSYIYLSHACYNSLRKDDYVHHKRPRFKSRVAMLINIFCKVSLFILIDKALEFACVEPRDR